MPLDKLFRDLAEGDLFFNLIGDGPFCKTADTYEEDSNRRLNTLRAGTTSRLRTLPNEVVVCHSRVTELLLLPPGSWFLDANKELYTVLKHDETTQAVSVFSWEYLSVQRFESRARVVYTEVQVPIHPYYGAMVDAVSGELGLPDDDPAGSSG